MDAGRTGLKAGVARAVINPPLTLPHAGWGAQSHRFADGIEADLLATVLILSDGVSTAVIIGMDTNYLLPEQSDGIRGRVASVLELDSASVRLSYTHTHSGPMTWHDYYPEGRHVRLLYMDCVAEQIAGAALQARSGMVPVRVAAGAGRCEVGKNRRQRLPDGRMVVGYNEAGYADPTVRVIRFDDAAGAPLASIVQYACHPTVLGFENRLVSPGYPGVTQRTVERLVGGTCLFLQGAAGDIGPGPVGFGNDTEAMRRLGTILGCAASQALLQADTARGAYVPAGIVESGATLGLWRWAPEPDAGADASVFRVAAERIRVPVKPMTPLAEARATAERMKRELDRLQREHASSAEIRSMTAQVKRAYFDWHRSEIYDGQTAQELEVHLVRIGETVLIGLPVEPFSEIGKEIVERSPFAHTVFGGYTNGWYGYLPGKKEYALGGYEVETSPFSEEAAAGAVRDIVALLQKLQARG